jgi:hypothetical protein
MCPPLGNSFAAELSQLERDRPLQNGEILTKFQTDEVSDESVLMALCIHLAYRLKLDMADFAKGTHGIAVIEWGLLAPRRPGGCFGGGSPSWIWVIYTRAAPQISCDAVAV